MKIGILTFHFVANYGALLQTYGLFKYLESRGCQVEVINFVPFNTEANLLRGWGLNDITKRPLYNVRKRLGEIRKVAKLKKFAENEFHLSKLCKSESELKEVAASYDVVVVGSDQVWNYYTTKRVFYPEYFLSFFAGKKISFSASCGEIQPDNIKENISTYIAKFAHVAVRDSLTEKFIGSLTDKKITETCDPTFLIDYAELSKRSMLHKRIPEKYILVFDFWSLQEIEKTTKSIKKELDLPIVSLVPNPYADFVVWSPSIEDWLYAFAKSTFICTQSFHGIVFALKNRKNFFLVEKKGKENHRVRDLLNRYSIEGHIINEENPISAIDLKTPIDYSISSSLIDEHIAISKKYLEHALNN